MRIFVDADACPVKKQVVEVAKRHQVPVTMVMDSAHEYEDGYSQVVTVDKQRNSADIRLINLVKRGDLVVTQDYGVAAMALSKSAAAIHQNGMIYGENNIDGILFERYLSQRLRQSGQTVKGPRKRTKEDDKRFLTAMEELVTRLCKEEKKTEELANNPNLFVKYI